MSLSINTNRGATIALQSLNRTNRELDAVQKRVSTGYKVADAKDDGAAFAIAQGLRSEIKAYGALNERYHETIRIIKIADISVNQVNNCATEMKSLLVKLGDDSLSAEGWATYKQDYQNLYNEIIKIDAGSKVNGIGILGETGAYHYLPGGIHGEQTNFIHGIFIGNPFAMSQIADVNNAADARAMLAPGGGMSNYRNYLSRASGAIGGWLRSYNNQIDFNEKYAMTLNDAMGHMVDADLAKDSARLQALQIRQQLGTQSLSIANQAPKALLSLFQ